MMNKLFVGGMGILVILCLLAPAASLSADRAPALTDDTFGWQLSNVKVVSAGETKTSKEGTLTRGYVVEGKAKATGASTPIQNGVFRVSVSAFSPAVDGVGQKAGVWYVQGTWKIVDDKATKKEKEARYSPVSLKGAIRAELPFNPAVSLGTVTAIVDIPSSPVAGRWTRGAGNFLGNEKFEGVMQIEATLWPDVAKIKGVKK
jgi:hypothetical protein